MDLCWRIGEGLENLGTYGRSSFDMNLCGKSKQSQFHFQKRSKTSGPSHFFWTWKRVKRKEIRQRPSRLMMSHPIHIHLFNLWFLATLLFPVPKLLLPKKSARNFDANAPNPSRELPGQYRHAPLRTTKAWEARKDELCMASRQKCGAKWNTEIETGDF